MASAPLLVCLVSTNLAQLMRMSASTNSHRVKGLSLVPAAKIRSSSRVTFVAMKMRSRSATLHVLPSTIFASEHSSSHPLMKSSKTLDTHRAEYHLKMFIRRRLCFRRTSCTLSSDPSLEAPVLPGLKPGKNAIFFRTRAQSVSKAATTFFPASYRLPSALRRSL